MAKVEPTELDWARLAAFLDGEGCIYIHAIRSTAARKYKNLYVDITVTNTDPRLIDWLRERWDGSVAIQKRRNPKWATSYAWTVVCRGAVNVLEHCLPYFIIKREQAETALAFQKLQTRKYGVKGTPQEIRDEKWALKNRLDSMKGRRSVSKHNAAGESLPIQ